MDTPIMRPPLEKGLDAETFIEHYYLKEELHAFCKENGLPTAGNKRTLAEKIEYFLRTGRTVIGSTVPAKRNSSPTSSQVLSLQTVIGENFTCTQKHRAFFQSVIGKKFHFSVGFQDFLRSNPDRTYGQVIEAWYRIEEEGKKRKGNTQISPQFEYNRYIRSFFDDNKDKSLQDAIQCWRYKRNLPGPKNYERSDLDAIK